jgi:glycerol-3-phosphate dehydrogenase subunit C
MKTFLDWSAYRDAGMGDAYADIPKQGGDFAKAVAVCINSRQCETLNKGVMCPSYRVDEDASLSTGARVRLLKALLNGDVGSQAFLASDLVRAMELCVSCKGCKRECEGNVDMAQIKIEYLAQLNAITGISLRARLFAGLPRWLHNAAWLKRLMALRNRHAWLARWGERLLGISAKRPLPAPAIETFQSTTPSGRPNNGLPVVLFVDTFSHHFEPEIARAAQDVLSAAGYAVTIAKPIAQDSQRPLCCGRTYLSQGLIEPAKEEARRVLAALLPHARRAVPIVGLEPSCLLTLRDEYKALGLGDEVLEVAGQAMLFEEFLAKELSAGRLKLPLRPLETHGEKTLIHGHCHQKAVGAMKSMRKVLKLIPQFEFEMIEASCCGMAGSFGLEAEHQALSLTMAEQSLLPTLRQAPEARIVANGYSCRQQIMDGVQRRSVHLAVLLRDALNVDEFPEG